MSFLFGDAVARQFLSMLIEHGFGWRGLFYCSAAVVGVLLLLNLALLRETPASLGYSEPHANPANLFEEEGEKHRPSDMRSLLGTFARSRVFWLVCLLSLGMTLVRETFNLWTPTYFTQALGFTNSAAAQKSALFPLFGGLSVILAGFLSDRFGKSGRAAIIFFGLLATGLALLGLAYADPGQAGDTAVALVALVALMLIGPYSYLAGAISLDFGGKQGSATASGLIDCIGYLGGALAGNGMANVSVAWGCKGAFIMLAAVAWISSVAAGFYLLHQRRT